MKKYAIIMLMYVFQLMFNINTVQAEEITLSQNIPCDFHKASADFANFIQSEIENNPNNYKKINAEFQTLANEIMILMQEGKTDEVCKKYTQFQIKY